MAVLVEDVEHRIQVADLAEPTALQRSEGVAAGEPGGTGAGDPVEDVAGVVDIGVGAHDVEHGQGVVEEVVPELGGGVDGVERDGCGVATRITKYVEAGQAWLVRLSGETVGTFALTEESDPDFADGWPDGPSDALYIYRMAVRRSYAGKEIGTRILNWASARAAALGKRWLRLDVHRRNIALHRYYEQHGFERVGTVVRVVNAEADPPFTRNSGALFQRHAGTIYHADGRQVTAMTDRYDPTGEAAVWLAAAELVGTLRRDDETDEAQTWNAALAQASRALENESRAIRQRDGMYFRVISGASREG